jgi:hypothetical protein
MFIALRPFHSFHRHNVDDPLVDVDVFSYPMFVIY